MKPEDVERIKDLLPTDLGSEEYRGKIAADANPPHLLD